ncbi:uncharacterized protein LOC126905387 isoform X2 [Daktulosphaira vitifoliae]|uniref:uncharacterized protein LOC126905387 isoform X2 n=1 Tax=Daktulosphaira vitifoliae TaxID=58002 RepID=UPI0021AAD4A2|nr:uncharacterized protein LOC126905387 isoform X2 [Daktulosphaira vitifoliae]
MEYKKESEGFSRKNEQNIDTEKKRKKRNMNKKRIENKINKLKNQNISNSKFVTSSSTYVSRSISTPLICDDKNVKTNSRILKSHSRSVPNVNTCKNEAILEISNKNENNLRYIIESNKNITESKIQIQSKISNNFRTNQLIEVFKQFTLCEDNLNACCTICKCKVSYEKSILKNHIIHCKKKKLKSYFIDEFICLLCDVHFKSQNKWKLHIISSVHITKCTDGNHYFSYNCGGCKAMFYGPEDQILTHCKSVHKDWSALPCIFKLLSEVFYQFFFNPKNNKTWSFCGPCKIFSDSELNCQSYNHRMKKSKSFNCNSCLIELNCSQDVYDKHILSCEHIMIEHLRITTNKLNYISNLELPVVILNQYFVNSKKATCKACKIEVLLNEDSISNHLIECIIKQDKNNYKHLEKIKKFFCAVCNEIMSSYNTWRYHLFTLDHIKKCLHFNDLISYTCNMCALHCYGSEYFAVDHQKVHPNQSEVLFSKFMAFNFQRIFTKSNKKLFYYCEPCTIYEEVNSNTIHWSKSHEIKLQRIVCDTCHIEFFCDDGNELYLKHELSSEHLSLKYLTSSKSDELTKTSFNNNKKMKKKSITSLESPKISKSILEWFSVDKDTYKCLVCGVLITCEHDLLIHLFSCNKLTFENNPETLVQQFECLECPYKCNTYKEWETHAILHSKQINTKLYSYFCKLCYSMFYGEHLQIINHCKNEHFIDHLSLPMESLIMQKLFISRKDIQNNYYDKCYFCEPCKKHFKVKENLIHFNTDSHVLVSSDTTELFYCPSCQIEFNCSLYIYNQHKLSIEHIILSLNYETSNEKIISKPNELDFYLLKFVINKEMYEETQNIGFYCFLCNYLCNVLDEWKKHINNKKHSNLIKGLNLDHRCKICKTLMFGQRHQIFEHYKNQLHSFLRVFKLQNKNDVPSTEVFEEINHEIEENRKKEISVMDVLNKQNFNLETSNFSNYFKTQFEKMKESYKASAGFKNQVAYFCTVCDFITPDKDLWENHEKNGYACNIKESFKIFCEVCGLFILGFSNNLKNHITSTEHKIMAEYQLLIDNSAVNHSNDVESKKIEIHSNNKLENTLKIKEEKAHSKKEVDDGPNNRKIFIEIIGAKPEYKKNSWAELKKIFAEYGYIRIFSNNNSVMVLYRKLSSMNHMLKFKEILEKKHDFSIHKIDDDDRMPELNKQTELEFSHKIHLIKLIDDQLNEITYEITNPSIPNRLISLINSIYYCAGPHFYFGRTYVFGSRMSGLAVRDSDVDLYFDIGNTFNGLLSNDASAQEDLVRYFGKVFRSQSKDFKNIQTICGARVPIVKFLHIPSGLHCDLSFKSGLSTHNTKLVRLYLMLDKRVHWVVCAVVKRWAIQNDLKNQSMFTSYALAWLVFFYLMTIHVVPSLKFLREHASISDIMFIEDWDCTFCTPEKAKQMWKVPEISQWELLRSYSKRKVF